MTPATFVERGHRYEVDGLVVPSVTQVLTLAGISDVSGIPVHHLERASQIGTAVHEACEFLDQDDLDLESLDPLVLGYVVAYQKFREEFGFKPDLIESRRVAEVGGMSYGMCVDRVGVLAGQLTVLDLKTASRANSSWAIQTAAYACGLGDPADYRRAAVHLNKEGKYKLIQYAQASDDDAAWCAALTVAHWKLAHGAKIKDF